DGTREDRLGQMDHRLSKLGWEPVGHPTADPRCSAEAWAGRGRAPAEAVPLIPTRPWKLDLVVDLHQKKAAGEPPLTVQAQGLELWILCGAPDALARAIVAEPPPPS